MINSILEILLQIILAYFQIVMIVFGAIFFAFGVSSFFTITQKKKNVFMAVFLCSMGAAMFGLPVYFIQISTLTFVVWGATAIFMGFKFSKYINRKAFIQAMKLSKARRERSKVDSIS